MELEHAASALSALAQPSRLRVFRLLVAAQAPLAAGDIAEQLQLPKPTLSFHLKELCHAGLILAHREGRSIRYEVAVEGIRELMGFLTEDCCQGRPELCLPNAVAGCCTKAN